MENAAVKTSGTYSNPLGEINLNWNEAAMNASMESVLTGYGDPRLEKFFKPCGSNLVIAGDAGDGTVVLKGQYHGIRQGTGFSHNYYAAFSRLTVDTDTDAVLMTAAEVWFLRAEAALRGWTDEDAERCYRNGVAASFAQWQLSGAESYLGSDAMAADYHDPVDPGNDIAARCRVSPRWDAAADAELKLERIITQKWIAMYPEGCEAWAEQRRTGYPRLFPVRLNHSKGYIDTETMIRRLPFPAVLATSDPEQYAALVAELGGEDHGGRACGGTRGAISDPEAPDCFARALRRAAVVRISACAQQDIARADGIAVGARAYSVEGRIGIFFTAEKVCGGRRSFPFPVYFPAQRCVGQ